MMTLGKSLIYFSTSLKSNEAVLERLMRSKLMKKYEEDEDLLEDVIIEHRQALKWRISIHRSSTVRWMPMPRLSRTMSMRS